MKKANYRPYTLKEFLLHLVIACIAAFLILIIGEKQAISKLVQAPGFGRFWIKNVLMIWVILLLIRYGRQQIANLSIRFIPFALPLWMAFVLGVAYALSALYFYSEGVRFSRIPYFNTLFPLTFVFVLLINCYEWYLEQSYLGQQQKRQLVRPLIKNPNDQIIVYDQKKPVFLFTHEIQWVAINNRRLHVKTFSDLNYTVYKTLIWMEQNLIDQNEHFMVNKSLIVHHRAVQLTPFDTYRKFLIKVKDIAGDVKVGERRYGDFLIWYNLHK
jgi:DNA-binding LytR/AlgR family response regulator